MGEVDRSRLGSEAEEQCVIFLERAGYRIRERNWLVREGELDIVAERDEVLCFVEVRMRTSAVFGDPSLTVTWEKQRRVVRAALRYLQRWPAPRNFPWWTTQSRHPRTRRAGGAMAAPRATRRP